MELGMVTRFQCLERGGKIEKMDKAVKIIDRGGMCIPEMPTPKSNRII